MKLRQHTTASSFLEANEKFLEKEEAINSLLLGLTYSNQKKKEDKSLYLDLSDQGDIIFCAIKTPGRNLIIYGNEKQLNKTIPAVLKFIKKNNVNLPGINGPKKLVLPFAKAIQKELQWNYKKEYQQWAYKLTTPTTPSTIIASLANTNHRDLVALWLKNFYKEVLHTITMEEAIDITNAKIKNKEVYLWPLDNPKTMCCVARPTNNGITINYVYTPPEKRGRGYASLFVSAISRAMISNGYRFCSLFADANNRLTNKMYKKIGYKPIEEFLSVKFN